MNLSELQTKEVINITTGRRIGMIVDVVVDNDGRIRSLILEEKRSNRKFLSSREELEINWQQIMKIGDDIILVDTRNRN